MLMYAAKSDIGCKREYNEDSVNIIIGKGNQPVGVVVADGMGGHSSGDVASKIAVETMSRILQGCAEQSISADDIELALSDGFDEANNAILDYGQANNCGGNCGTTLTAAYIMRSLICIAHIGDSRAYLLREGVLTSLTRDHSYVQELVERGYITREEARVHPEKNKITRALGFEFPITPDVHLVRSMPGDVLAICSDGLWEAITEAELTVILLENMPQEAVEKLVHLANSRGGKDNITVAIVRMDS